VNWNLEYDDPPALRHDLENQLGMVPGSTFPGPHGPQVIPGVYTLKLTVDGQDYTRNVTVVNDPRVGQGPAIMAALRAQNQINLLSMQGMEQSYEGHAEVDAVQHQLSLLMHDDLPADVVAQAKTLDTNLTKIGGAPPPREFGGGPGRPAAREPNALQSFLDLNNDYNTMVSMVQVGLDMAPTPTQIASWESNCNNYNRTLAEWKKLQRQISDFNTLLEKDQLHGLTLAPTKLIDASCRFAAGGSRKVSQQPTPR
jgi:hypothetical protein